jgi:hypothetical protein
MQNDAFRTLFPTITESELSLATEILDQYLAFAWEIMQDAECLEAKS